MATNRLDGRFSREAAAGYDREVIERANIVLAGTGALGQFLALCLALIGYCRVTFIDLDRFEDSNATRSPFYRSGALKARATAEGALRRCTATTPISYRYAATHVQRLGDAIFENATAVLCAVDCRRTRAWLAQRTRLHGVPLIEGGFRAERWNVSTFLNGADDEPCWACGQQVFTRSRVFSCDAYARSAEARGFIPATAPGAMGLAAFMVGQLTQILHGNRQLANTLISTDARRGVMRVVERVCDPRCALSHCRARELIKLSITPDNTADALLGALEVHVPEPLVHLPAAFVRVAVCRACHGFALVEQPEWALDGPPLCTRCGGAAVPTDGVPEQHGCLARGVSTSVAHLTLQQLGLGSGLVLRVESDAGNRMFGIGGACALSTCTHTTEKEQNHAFDLQAPA